MSDIKKELGDRTVALLKNLIISNSGSMAERIIKNTSFILSLYSMSGHGFKPRTPSLLMLTPDNPGEDCVADSLASTIACVHDEDFIGKEKLTEGFYKNRSVAETLQWLNKMHAAIPEYEELYLSGYGGLAATSFGKSRAKKYELAWHEKLGLITNDSMHVHLRLCDDEDRKAFTGHVLSSEPDHFLRKPRGMNMELKTETKSVSVSGRLPVGMCSDDLYQQLMDLPAPYFLLPCPGLGLTPLGEESRLLHLVHGFAAKFAMIEPASTYLPQFDWSKGYEDRIRSITHHLPGSYEFATLEFIRTLHRFCEYLIHYCTNQMEVSEKDKRELAYYLYLYASRGVLVSLAGLAWQCHGMELGCDRSKAFAMLQQIRAEGEMNRREILRSTPVRTSDVRDRLLETFATKGLVELDGKLVRPVDYDTFARRLYESEEYAIPEVI